MIDIIRESTPLRLKSEDPIIPKLIDRSLSTHYTQVMNLGSATHSSLVCTDLCNQIYLLGWR